MKNFMTGTPLRLNGPRLRSLNLLLFWPIFFLIFTYAERYFPAAYYYSMHCRLDDLIPFCKWFVIPYVIWFPFVGGMVAYTFFRNLAVFRRLMKFIILTYSAALLVFFLFPTCQHLRPVLFWRHDLLTRMIASIYANDTNTNVCPSIHVIGSLAVWLAARDMKQLPPLLRKYLIPAMAILISVSTVFLKQHSALDILAALLVCAAAYPLVYRSPARRTAPLVVQAMEMEQSRSPQL
ncbi:MAG: phosphatidic acid phosphatase [Clostridiales bacterium]|nr:phosphatidic acid phosphatase [Clostridiales bacterium]